MKIIDIEVFNDDDGIGFIKHSDMLNLLEQIRIKQEEKNEEIERLNKRVEDLNTINEEHKVLNGMIRKELQQKENIIKEVREYIEIKFFDGKYKYELLEILDKE